jgi:ABC-2 type transport system permease protein
MNALKLYALLIKASVRSRMQYKFNFLLSSFFACLMYALEFSVIALILAKFGALEGWSLPEVAYLYGVIILAHTIYRIFASDVHRLENYFVNGELDQLLIRPVPVLLALMSQNFSMQAGQFVQSFAVLVFAISSLLGSGTVGWLIVPETVYAVLCGAVILFSIGLATATVGFWTMRINELQNLTEDASRNAALYPLDVFPGWLKTFLLTVIPVGFVNYVPALYTVRGVGGPWLLAATGAFALLFLAASLLFWRYGVTKYQSTGS